VPLLIDRRPPRCGLVRRPGAATAWAVGNDEGHAAALGRCLQYLIEDAHSSWGVLEQLGKLGDLHGAEP
jgi:hypothetical protein